MVRNRTSSNGFGGTPLQELYLFNNAVTRELAKKQLIECSLAII